MIANLVTASRIALLAPLFVLIQVGSSHSWAALGVFLLAGFTDVVDGRLARALKQVSRLGAMLDLLADRLLTQTVLLALIAAGALRGVFLVAGFILVARDIVVASFGEAIPSLGFRVNRIEVAKITLQFVGFALLIAPAIFTFGGITQHAIGQYSLMMSAAITLFTLVGYARIAFFRLNEQAS